MLVVAFWLLGLYVSRGVKPPENQLEYCTVVAGTVAKPKTLEITTALSTCPRQGDRIDRPSLIVAEPWRPRLLGLGRRDCGGIEILKLNNHEDMIFAGARRSANEFDRFDFNFNGRSSPAQKRLDRNRKGSEWTHVDSLRTGTCDCRSYRNTKNERNTNKPGV